jgi:hypothetical protein
VVTEDLRRNFHEALGMIGHAVTSGRSQASFLHSHAAAPETSLADLCEHGVITRSLLAVYLPCSERVDRTWQNQNHVSAVQGPVVAVRPVRKRVLAVS